MVKKFLLLMSVSLFAAVAHAADAKGSYGKSGETAGMDPVARDAGQKMVEKQPAKSPGMKPLEAAPKSKPEAIKGMGAHDETEGMDPKKPAGQKLVEKAPAPEARKATKKKASDQKPAAEKK